METQIAISLEDVIEQFSDRIHRVENGEEKALPVYSELHLLEKSIKELKKQITDEAIGEAGNYHKNDTPVFNGFTPKLSSKKTFSYKHDDTWNSYEAKKKERQNLMKKAMKATITDPDTGELIPAAEFKESVFIKMEKV